MSVNGVLSYRWGIHILLLIPTKAQGPLWKMGGETVRARGQRRTAVKWCLLDKTVLMHSTAALVA